MSATAKIFQHGRSQAVRLPKEFRLPGKEVKVTRVGDAVLLEPIEEQKPFDADAFWAKLDALGARDFLAEGLPDDPLLEPDEISFDGAMFCLDELIFALKRRRPAIAASPSRN